MRTAFARMVLQHNLVVAAVLLAALGGCGREAPTELRLEAPVLTYGLFSADAAPSASRQLDIAGVVGQPATVTLEVVDQNGRTVSGIPISWAVMHNGGSTNVASSTTDSSGTASVSWTLDTIAKPDSLRASIPTGDAMLVIATAQHGAAFAATKISGDSQTVALGEASEPFIVRLTDRYANPISGVHVAWIVNGGGSLSALTTATDASGTTQVTLSGNSGTPGTRQIVATYGILRASTFALTAAAPTSQIRRIQVVTHPIPF